MTPAQRRDFSVGAGVLCGSSLAIGAGFLVGAELGFLRGVGIAFLTWPALVVLLSWVFMLAATRREKP